MKRQSFCALRGRGGELNSEKDKQSRTVLQIVSFFYNNLMKRQSFRASRGRGGGGTSFSQGLPVEKGTINRLLFQII